MFVGRSDGPGEETFDVVVCTPHWLGGLLDQQGDQFTLGRHYLFVTAFDGPRLIAFLKGFVESVDEPTWKEVAEKIGRLGRWEFEDYRPS
jgi:hypothetical protein